MDSRFKSAWWLRNCHLQTLFPPLFRNITAPELRRERLVTPDSDFIDVDWCGNENNHPLVILLHGLSGSSQSVYIKGLQHALLQNNFRSVALNFRGCSGEPNNLARCYHLGETEDIDFLYSTLLEREPKTLIAAVGFSLGANVLLKWLGEKQNTINLFSAVAVSTSFVLSACATKLDNGFSKLYRDNLLQELKAFIYEKGRYLEKIGNLSEAEKIKQCGDLSKLTSFWEYDNQVVARLHGFQDVFDYYARSSSRQFLKTIAIPTLLIQAQDDPFMTADVIPLPNELSPFVQLEITKHGGHVGFVAGKNPFAPVYWLEKRVPLFLHEMANCHH